MPEHSARKPFLIHPRPSKKFKRIFYVQFRMDDDSLLA